MVYPMLEADPDQSRLRQHDRVIPAGVHCGQTGIDVATDLLYLHVGPEQLELRGAARATGPDDRTRLQILERCPTQHVPRCRSFRVDRLESIRSGHRQVLAGVDGDVGRAVKNGPLDRAHECTYLG